MIALILYLRFLRNYPLDEVKSHTVQYRCPKGDMACSEIVIYPSRGTVRFADMSIEPTTEFVFRQGSGFVGTFLFKNNADETLLWVGKDNRLYVAQSLLDAIKSGKIKVCKSATNPCVAAESNLR